MRNVGKYSLTDVKLDKTVLAEGEVQIKKKRDEQRQHCILP